MLRAIADAVPAVYRPRLGMAAGKFPASVAALQTEPGSASFKSLREQSDTFTVLGRYRRVHIQCRARCRENEEVGLRAKKMAQVNALLEQLVRAIAQLDQAH